MDFFTRQDDAQSKSRTFYAAFGLAIAVAVVLFYFAVTMAILLLCARWRLPVGPLADQIVARAVATLPEFIYGWPPAILSLRPMLILCPLITAVVLLASYHKTKAIKEGGGAYIAAALGAELVETPRGSEETLLINVVEEMAVAAGLPRPRVYILRREKTINAITAGLDYEDAVIAVTQGAVTHLDRDELQAVVAHEFAHILNGDFSLNLTMAGWLYGLLFFSMKGQELLDSSLEGMDKALRGVGALTSHIPGSNILAIFYIPKFLAGFFLWAGGWVGRLVASVVQAAFSRQREYLADAFAVQFTRSASGLAGALKKIAGLPKHGVLRSGQSIMMKAFFIVSPTKMDGLLKTHPPLESRILALEPHWDGTPILIDHPDFQPLVITDFQVPVANRLVAGRNQSLSGKLVPAGRVADNFARNWAAIMTSFELLAAATRVEKPAAGDSAPKTGGDASSIAPQTKPHWGNTPPLPRECADGSAELRPNRPSTKPHWGNTPPLPRGCADGSAELRPNRPSTNSVAGLLVEIQRDVALALSAMCWRGNDDNPDVAAEAFAVGWEMFPHWPPMIVVARDFCTPEDLEPALTRLGSAPKKIRETLVLAAAAAAVNDRRVDLSEYEYLRVLTTVLDVPLPFMKSE